jgi:hypothetical protein
MQAKQIISTLLFALLIAGTFSCSKPRTIIPPEVLTEKEMIPLLVDVHIAQAATSMFDSNDSVKYKMDELLSYILSIHHVERARYDSSISFYTRHPEIMQRMYDEVINELSKKQGEVSSK